MKKNITYLLSFLLVLSAIYFPVAAKSESKEISGESHKSTVADSIKKILDMTDKNNDIKQQVKTLTQEHSS